MSDFLSRIAARAVGRAAVTQPRLPALFEETDPGDAGLDVSGAHGFVTQLVHTEAAPRATAQARDASAQPSRRAVPSSPLLPVRTPPSPDFPPPASEAPENGVRGAPVVPAQEADPAEAEQPAAPTRPAAAIGVPPLPMPIESTPATSAAPSADDEPPVVRVHIGRLEVRANLQPAPQQPPRRAQPERRELSLGDYLRGAREAR